MGFSPFVCLCNCVVHGKNNLRFAIFPRGIAKVAAKLGPLAMVGLRQQHRQVIMKSRGLGLTATRRAANSPMTHGIEHLQGGLHPVFEILHRRGCVSMSSTL
jgi:hypothetical protein